MRKPIFVSHDYTYAFKPEALANGLGSCSGQATVAFMIRHETPESTPPQRLSPLWIAVAAVAGLLCVVLPPYLVRGALTRPAYGVPLIPWFAVAFANIWSCWRISMISSFLVGVGLGYARPRSWLPLSCLTVSLAAILNAANVIHDAMRDRSSHNLLPFEFAMLAFICGPAIPGAFIGRKLRGLANAA